MNNNWHQVFVYGTLMQSANTIRSLDKFGDHAEFVACSHTESASYTMHNLGYFPGVVLSGTDKVAGEVWRVTSEAMHELDIIEGYPDFYKREITQTQHGQAWMYYLPDNLISDSEIVKSNRSKASWLDCVQSLSVA